MHTATHTERRKRRQQHAVLSSQQRCLFWRCRMHIMLARGCALLAYTHSPTTNPTNNHPPCCLHPCHHLVHLLSLPAHKPRHQLRLTLSHKEHTHNTRQQLPHSRSTLRVCMCGMSTCITQIRSGSAPQHSRAQHSTSRAGWLAEGTGAPTTQRNAPNNPAAKSQPTNQRTCTSIRSTTSAPRPRAASTCS